jgi:uncharacterized protein YjiS (DUF1127 family)
MEMHSPQSLVRIHSIRTGPMRRAASPGKPVLAFICNRIAERRRARRIPLSVRELERLDTHLLRDLGIERYQIEQKARDLNPPAGIASG